MKLTHRCPARMAADPNVRCWILVAEQAVHTEDHAGKVDGLTTYWPEQVAVYPTGDGNFLSKDGLAPMQVMADPLRHMPQGLISPAEYETRNALLSLADCDCGPGGHTLTGTCLPAGSARDRQVGGDHYRKHKIQHWDIAAEYGLNYFEGAVLKYILRHRDKNGVEDLKKARHTLDRLIELEEARGQGPGDHGSSGA